MDKLLKSTIVRNLSYSQLRTWYSNLIKPRLINPPYRHVVQIGDPVLRMKSSDVEIEDLASEKIISLVKYLKYLFKMYDSFGLSAPQVGVPLRIFLMEFNKNDMKRYTPDEIKRKDMCPIPMMVS